MKVSDANFALYAIFTMHVCIDNLQHWPFRDKFYRSGICKSKRARNYQCVWSSIKSSENVPKLGFMNTFEKDNIDVVYAIFHHFLFIH